MDTTSCVLVLYLLAAVGVQGGPYIWKPRPVAGPLVDHAQTSFHDQFLRVESQVLQDSLDVGRLATLTTEVVYQHTRDAMAAISTLQDELDAEVTRLRLGPGRSCVNAQAYRQLSTTLNNLSERLYNCSHSVSDGGVWFEVKMTHRIVAARDHVWFVKQAMSFCHKFQQEADTECLKRLMSEGALMLRELPERGRAVLTEAQAAKEEALDKLGRCLARHRTAAEAKQLAEMEMMRSCVQKQEEQ